MKKLFPIYLFILVQLFVMASFLGVQQEANHVHRLLYACQLLMSVALLVDALLFSGPKMRVKSWVLRLTMLFCFYLLLNSFALRHYSEYQIEFDQVRSMLAVLIWLAPICVVPFYVQKAKDIQPVLNAIGIGSLLASLSVVCCFLGAKFGFEFGEVIFFDDGRARYFGPLGDQVSFFITLGLLISLATRKALQTTLHIAAIFLTGTRGSLSVLVVGVFILMSYSFWHLSKVNARVKMRLRLGALAIFIAIGCVAFSPIGTILFERILDPDRLESGVSSRTSTMLIGLELVEQYPWFGVGFAGFTEHAYRMGAYLDFAHFDPALLANTSNQYIEAAVNGGIIGLTLYLALMLRVLFVAHRTMRLAAINLKLPLMGISAWLMGVIIGMHTAILILPTSLICLYFFACACFSEKVCSLLTEEQSEARPIKYAPKPNMAPIKRHIPAHL